MGTITILRKNLLIACIIQENQNLLDEGDAMECMSSVVYNRTKDMQSASSQGQAIKSARGMPWHQEPMKDVTSCEKLRGAANEH